MVGVRGEIRLLRMAEALRVENDGFCDVCLVIFRTTATGSRACRSNEGLNKDAIVIRMTTLAVLLEGS